MTDFWEMIGRLVADTNFRDALFAFSARNYPVAGSFANIPAVLGNAGEPNDDYDALRLIVQQQPNMNDKPLSISALGVMLYGISLPEFQTRAKSLAQEITNSGVALPPVADSRFYIALGAVVVDGRLRNELVAGNWQRWGFNKVADADRKTLTTLMNGIDNPAVVTAATTFCSYMWDGSCDNKAVEWDGYLQYVTPLHL